jgi:hypothetical protein
VSSWGEDYTTGTSSPKAKLKLVVSVVVSFDPKTAKTIEK